MANLENLNIQVTAATGQAIKSIDSLLKQLGKLNSALHNTGIDSSYVRSLTDIATGIELVAESSQSVNTAGLKAVTDAIDKLVSKGEALKTLDFSSLTNVHLNEEQFSGITAIANSLGKLTGKNAEKAVTSLPALSTGLASLASIQIQPGSGEAIASLATGVSKLGSVKAVAAQDVGRIAEGLVQLNMVDIDTSQVEKITSFASAISRLGYKSVVTAIDNIPALANAFWDLTATLSSAPQVSQETLRLAEAMAQFATATKGVSTGTKQASRGVLSLESAFRSALPTFNRVKKHTFSLAAMFGKLYASYFLVIRAFRGLGKAIEVSSSLTEVENVVAATFGNMTDALDDFADTSMYKFGLAELAAKQYASRFQAMGSAMGITTKQVTTANDFLTSKLASQKRDIEGVEDSYKDLGTSMSDMSINLTKLVSDYASFFNMDYGDVAKDFESIFTGQTRPMRQYGIDLTNATLKEWALKNGMDANIKSMTQAEKTMLRYQYVMAQSGKVMNDYQITMNNWANVVRTIGQQFTKLGSIIGQGLINTFKPVLIGFREFMNTFIEMTQKGLNAIGKLLGWQIEIEEVGVTMNDDMEDYADSLDDAAGSAKKLNTQLRGIDELNNLTTSKKGSGSGDNLSGGLAGYENGVTGGLFKIEKYESDINSWQELGYRIRDKIISGFKSISWDEISKKVKLNAKGLSDFLIGLLMPDNDDNTIGGEIGGYLANVLNLGFDWLVTFTGDKNLWNEAGGNIADFITKFFEEFDPTDAGDTIDNIVQGLVTMISTAVEDLKKPENREMILEKFREFFQSIDAETWGDLVGVAEIALAGVTIKSLGKVGFSALASNGLELGLGGLIGTELGFAIAPLISPSGSRENFNRATLTEGIVDFFTEILPDKQMTANFLETWAEDQNVWGVFGTIFNEYHPGTVEKMQNPYEVMYNMAIATYGPDGPWQKMAKEIEETGQKIYGSDGFWAKIGKKAEEIGEPIYGPNGFWAKVYKKAYEVGDPIYGENGFWAKFYKKGEKVSIDLGQAIYGDNGFWAKLWEKGSEKGLLIYGEDGLWAKIFRKGKEKFENLGQSIYGPDGFWAKIWNKASEIWKQISDLFNQDFTIKLPHFKWDAENGTEATGLIAKALEALNLPTKIPKLSVEWYAQGGFPQTGSLFYAGEAGAELLGSVNGRTTVASNGEITGISDTIRQTSSEEIQLLRQQNQLLQGILQKEFGISKGELFKSVRSSASEYHKMTGNPAFA